MSQTVATLLEKARTYMAENQLPEVHFTFGRAVATMSGHWMGEHNDLLGFLADAKAMNAVAITISEAVLEDEFLAQFLEYQKQIEDIEKQKEILQAYRNAVPHIGELAEIFVTAIVPEPPIQLNIIVDESWYLPLVELADEMDEPEDDEIGVREEGDKALEPIARELAMQPDFQRAPSNDAREYVARKYLGDKAPAGRNDLYRICSLAYGIYTVELKPQHDLELQAKAREMLQNGMKKGEIASKLGITPNKLAKLLA